MCVCESIFEEPFVPGALFSGSRGLLIGTRQDVKTAMIAAITKPPNNVWYQRALTSSPPAGEYRWNPSGTGRLEREQKALQASLRPPEKRTSRHERDLETDQEREAGLERDVVTVPKGGGS